MKSLHWLLVHAIGWPLIVIAALAATRPPELPDRESIEQFRKVMR